MLVGLKSLADRRRRHHRRHRLRLRHPPRRGRADQMLLRLGDDQPARQSRHDRARRRSPAARRGSRARRITRAQLVAVIRQRLEHLTAQIEDGAQGAGLRRPVRPAGRADRRRRRAEGRSPIMPRACSAARSGSAGRRMPGLPEAHSGPAFSTLAGLALFAASDDARPARRFRRARRRRARRARGNWLQRLIAAFRTQY